MQGCMVIVYCCSVVIRTLNIKELMHAINLDIFCATILKQINDMTKFDTSVFL